MKKQDNGKNQNCSRPIGKPGLMAKYCHEKENDLPGSVVQNLTLILGSIEEGEETEYQWFCLHGTKANSEAFSIWLLSSDYPPQARELAGSAIIRYIFQEGNSEPLEFRDQFTGEVVLPVLGGWEYLIPRPAEEITRDVPFSQKVRYLGHTYLLDGLESGTAPDPPSARILNLLPDVLIGPAHNSRQRDETRQYDGSDYELVPLTEDDYSEMIEAGINCLRVDAEQVKWIRHRDIFYWGIGGNDVNYPECLYRSNYLGPGIFMDEPAVCTRDHVLRPRLERDKNYREALTVQMAFEEFQSYFHKAKYEGAPTRLLSGLAARPDVDIGNMEFFQQNIYTWETMVSSAAYQLSEDQDGPPNAIVFEPPGRVGTMRTLPEINMTYGCQIPTDDPKNFTDIIYGFLRGAARLTNKSWGMSIYGQLHRADAFWYQTHAYDLGASLFLYWDSHELACVPYSEYLALSRNLRAHAESHPRRHMKKLKKAAEILILLPPGYGLGHIHMGRGNLWGLGELNLERRNREGVKYRVVMSNFFTEIERCIRLGVSYDLLWDLEALDVSGYREIARIREDGKVQIIEGKKETLYETARTPIRPSGESPQLTIELSTSAGRAPLKITACATIIQGSAPVYYTTGADSQGVYENAMVCWELFGPGEADYRFLNWEDWNPRIAVGDSVSTVRVDFNIDAVGNYRLRAATVDMAGRTTVAWKTIAVWDK